VGPVGPEERGPGDPGPHLVGGVGQLRDDDGVARPDAQQRRQPRDQFLRADRGQHRDGIDGDAEAPQQGAGDRGAQRGGTVGGGVARFVGGRSGQRGPDGGRDRVDRRADGQVDDAVGMRGGEGLVLGEGVPGEVRQ